MLNWIQPHTPIDMQFEYLLRTIYNDCDTYGDPFHFAHADKHNNFSGEGVQQITLRGKIILSVVISRISSLINNIEVDNQLRLCLETVENMTHQAHANLIIEQLIEICRNNGIE